MAVTKCSALAQLEMAQVTLMTVLGDLYFLAYYRSKLTEGVMISYVENYGQKLIYPSNLIRHTLTSEFSLIYLIEGYCSVESFLLIFAPVNPSKMSTTNSLLFFNRHSCSFPSLDHSLYSIFVRMLIKLR
jgi:hypothetical protein